MSKVWTSEEKGHWELWRWWPHSSSHPPSATSCMPDVGYASTRCPLFHSHSNTRRSTILVFSILQMRKQRFPEIKQHANPSLHLGKLSPEQPRARVFSRIHNYQAPEWGLKPLTYELSFTANHNAITVSGRWLKSLQKKKKRFWKLLVTTAGKSWNLKFVLADLHHHRSRVYIENVWSTLWLPRLMNPHSTPSALQQKSFSSPAI